MRLRSSKVLKLFAILLFSLEMVGPAFASSSNSPENVKGTVYTNAVNFYSFLYSSLYEESENEEGERDGKDHKFTPVFTDLAVTQSYTAFTCTSIHRTSGAEPVNSLATRPPLFTLFHSYLI